jgi:hypothetical protein
MICTSLKRFRIMSVLLEPAQAYVRKADQIVLTLQSTQDPRWNASRARRQCPTPARCITQAVHGFGLDMPPPRYNVAHLNDFSQLLG